MFFIILIDEISNCYIIIDIFSKKLKCISKKLTKNKKIMVGLGGLEPPALRLSGVRSNRLSYKPIAEILLKQPMSSQSKFI